MEDADKTKEQLIEELVELRRSLADQGRANLLLGNSRIISTKRFAAGIAHEINNPLGIISGFAELALLNNALPQPVRDDIRVIYSECNRAARVLHDLLSFAGERPITTVPVDVEAIILQALKLKSNELDVFNINVTPRISPDLPPISSDPDQLIEVILNILDNAQQAMTETRGGGEIEIFAHRVEDRIRISIKDHGPGIPPGNMDRIFQPFFTTKEVGKGSGLGLSISLGILHQHGGDLWAESAPGEGSTFHLELPTNLGSPVDGPHATEPSREPAARRGMTRRIMVVNDELGFRQLLSRALAPGGHVVDLAGDWAEAWTLVQTHSYDCVILNLGLPAVNGMQLYERIKNHDPVLASRCVFITGYLLTPELESYLAATGVPYLTKPFAISQIRRLVLQLAESGSYPKE
jgi:CheY-like chemotaxis protein